MRRRRSLKVLCATPILIVMALGFPVGVLAAEDAKSYSPAFCQVDLDAYPDTKYDFIDGAFRVATNSPDPGQLVCPLVRDKVGSANGIQSVWVEIYHAIGLTACELYTLPEDQDKGSEVGWESAVTGGVVIPGVPGTQPGFVQLVFSGEGIDDDGEFAPAPPTSDGDEGAYVLICTIGPGGAVQQITLTEN